MAVILPSCCLTSPPQSRTGFELHSVALQCRKWHPNFFKGTHFMISNYPGFVDTWKKSISATNVNHHISIKEVKCQQKFIRKQLPQVMNHQMTSRQKISIKFLFRNNFRADNLLHNRKHSVLVAAVAKVTAYARIAVFAALVSSVLYCNGADADNSIVLQAGIQDPTEVTTSSASVESILARQLARRFREMSDEELIEVLQELLQASQLASKSQIGLDLIKDPGKATGRSNQSYIPSNIDTAMPKGKDGSSGSHPIDSKVSNEDLLQLKEAPLIQETYSGESSRTISGGQDNLQTEKNSDPGPKNLGETGPTTPLVISKPEETDENADLTQILWQEWKNRSESMGLTKSDVNFNSGGGGSSLWNPESAVGELVQRLQGFCLSVVEKADDLLQHVRKLLFLNFNTQQALGVGVTASATVVIILLLRLKLFNSNTEALRAGSNDKESTKSIPVMEVDETINESAMSSSGSAIMNSGDIRARIVPFLRRFITTGEQDNKEVVSGIEAGVAVKSLKSNIRARPSDEELNIGRFWFQESSNQRHREDQSTLANPTNNSPKIEFGMSHTDSKQQPEDEREIKATNEKLMKEAKQDLNGGEPLPGLKQRNTSLFSPVATSLPGGANPISYVRGASNRLEVESDNEPTKKTQYFSEQPDNGDAQDQLVNGAAEASALQKSKFRGLKSRISTTNDVEKEILDLEGRGGTSNGAFEEVSKVQKHSIRGKRKETSSLFTIKERSRDDAPEETGRHRMQNILANSGTRSLYANSSVHQKSDDADATLPSRDQVEADQPSNLDPRDHVTEISSSQKQFENNGVSNNKRTGNLDPRQPRDTREHDYWSDPTRTESSSVGPWKTSDNVHKIENQPVVKYRKELDSFLLGNNLWVRDADGVFLLQQDYNSGMTYSDPLALYCD